MEWSRRFFSARAITRTIHRSREDRSGEEAIGVGVGVGVGEGGKLSWIECREANEDKRISSLVTLLTPPKRHSAGLALEHPPRPSRKYAKYTKYTTK